MSSLSLFSAEKTPKTPYIFFDPQTGDFFIKGKSVPENVVSFYKPLMEWLDAYTKDPLERTVLNVQLDYFNTSSAKGLVDLFKKIESIETSGKGKVAINWHYDENDEDMMEAGDDFKSTVKIPVNLVPFVKEDE